MSKKERIDVLLARKGFFPSREKARAAIMAGLVLVNDERCDKPGTKVDEDSDIRIKGETHPYVSRGGLKLEKALRVFDVRIEGAVALDIGASTGGFTDCALRHGAKQVYAIDVGYGQLDWKLRSDPRVIVMERVNFRHLRRDELRGEQPDFAMIDVSFISLRKILPVLLDFLETGGQVVALVKPQFEAGRELVGKNGVVRDPRTHEQVLRSILSFAGETKFAVRGVDFSPITGGEGNIEFLLFLERQAEPVAVDPDQYDIPAIVEKARQSLVLNH